MPRRRSDGLDHISLPSQNASLQRRHTRQQLLSEGTLLPCEMKQPRSKSPKREIYTIPASDTQLPNAKRFSLSQVCESRLPQTDQILTPRSRKKWDVDNSPNTIADVHYIAKPQLQDFNNSFIIGGEVGDIFLPIDDDTLDIMETSIDGIYIEFQDNIPSVVDKRRCSTVDVIDNKRCSHLSALSHSVCVHHYQTTLTPLTPSTQHKSLLSSPRQLKKQASIPPYPPRRDSPSPHEFHLPMESQDSLEISSLNEGRLARHNTVTEHYLAPLSRHASVDEHFLEEGRYNLQYKGCADDLLVEDAVLAPLHDAVLAPLHDAELPRLHDAELPRLHDAELPRLHDAELPRLHDAELPRLHDAELPRLHDAELPRLHDAELPRPLIEAMHPYADQDPVVQIEPKVQVEPEVQEKGVSEEGV